MQTKMSTVQMIVALLDEVIVGPMRNLPCNLLRRVATITLWRRENFVP